jgi:hypothetical protein
MRLGKVSFGSAYVVDLDNKEMVEHAKEAVYDDLTSAVKFGDAFNSLLVEEAPDAEEGEIPEFLLDEENNC